MCFLPSLLSRVKGGTQTRKRDYKILEWEEQCEDLRLACRKSAWGAMREGFLEETRLNI